MMVSMYKQLKMKHMKSKIGRQLDGRSCVHVPTENRQYDVRIISSNLVNLTILLIKYSRISIIEQRMQYICVQSYIINFFLLFDKGLLWFYDEILRCITI